MENKSSTRTKKLKRGLRVFPDSSIEESSILHLKKSSWISDSADDSDIQISQINKSFQVEFADNNKFEVNSKNFNVLASELKHLNFQQQVKSKKTEKIFSKSFQNSYIKGASDPIVFDFEKIFNELSSLQILSSFLFNLKYFNNFNSLQFITHEKGKPLCPHYKQHRVQGYKSSKVSAEDFHQAFNLIKKSKSKQFNPHDFTAKNIDVVGTFFANTFSLKTHNVIFICSREDFLFPTDEEQENFVKVCNVLSPVLSKLIEKNKISNRFNIIHEVLENYPFPVSLIDFEGNTIFSNRPENSELNLIGKVQDEEFVEVNLKKGLKMVCFQGSGKENISDLEHFHRLKLLGDLLNTLGHELSNPLFGIGLTSEILASTQEVDENREFLEDIKSNSERCQTIIKNFSNLYSSNDDFEKVCLKSLLKETITLTKSESRGINKELILPDDELEIFTNSTWLSQIIFNLIVNSAQAIKAGSISQYPQIEIEVKKKENDIKILVVDNGPGIAEENQEKLFQPFFTTKATGTGLGLSICNNLSNKLNGSLSLSFSRPGKTIFSLIIPLERK